MNEIEIQLAYPIPTNGVTTNIIKVRRPTVGDSLVADSLSGSDLEKEAYLMASLCQISPEDIKKMDLIDYEKIKDALVKKKGD
ncbi:MAG: phage tail assembly protein [Pseudomonadota bacterium]